MISANKISKSKIKLLLIVGSILLSALVISFVQSASFEVSNQPEPTVSGTSVIPGTQDRGSSVVISSTVVDVSGVTYVRAQIKNGAGVTVANLNLYDDGVHNDGAAGNNVYGNTWTTPVTLAIGNYEIFITASDTLGNVYQTGMTTPFGDAGPRTEETNFDVTAPAATCPDGSCDVVGGECSSCVVDCSVTECCCDTALPCDPLCNAGVGENNGNCPGDCPVGCTDDCAIGEIGCMGLNNEWTCGEAGDGDICLDKITTACNAGETCNAATSVCECANTCVSLGYECGTHTFCGVPTTCPPGCTLPGVCNAFGKCEVVSVLSATIIEPENNTEYTQGDWINFGGTVLGGVPNYTWEWSSDQVDGVFSNNQWAGTNTLSANIHTITLTVTDSEGTTASGSISITIHPAGTLTTQIDMWQTEFAQGDTIWFGANVSGGTAPYTFVWNNGAIDFATGQWPFVDLSLTPWTPGNYTITVTVADNASNTATDSIDIKIVEMTADIHPEDGEHFIYGNNIWFSAFVAGGTVPYAFSWVSDLEGGEIGNNDNFSRNDLQEGIHTIAVTITDSGGIPITITKTFQIQIDPGLPLSASIVNPINGAIYDKGETIDFSSSVSGGVLPYSYEWNSDNDGNIGFIQDFIKNDLSVGLHIINFKITDSIGNIITDTVSITINCVENWSCGAWSACVGGNQTRICTDGNNCGTIADKPAESQSCSSVLNISIDSPSDNSSFADGDLIEFKSTVSGGVAPYSYSWSSNTSGIIGTADLFRKDNLSQNTHDITLTVTDNNGLSGNKQITIIVSSSECRPYLINGSNADKMDVVFIRDYDSTPDEIETQLNNFLYYEDTGGPYGLFKFEPIGTMRDKFNIYYYTKKRGGGCDFPFARPDGYNAKCSFADITVFPRSQCALNMASFSGYFCFGFSPAWHSYKTALVHESGHAMFQLADEYYGTPRGATFNLYTSFDSCENKRISKNWNSLVCEKICNSEGSATCQNRWRLANPADNYGKSCVMTCRGKKFLPDDQERITNVLNNYN